MAGFKELKDDGSTACGCWIYCGCFKDGVNQPARRKPGGLQSWVAPEWGWAWPANRRILYNRASADPDGKPWSDRKRYVWWDEEQKKWTGLDVPDFIEDRPPSYRPGKSAKGTEKISGIDPFIMQGDGKGWLYASNGLLDGPLPTHYEPQESVVKNELYGQQCNPARIEWDRKDNPYHRAVNDPRFPFVITTYRLTEHHTAGGMSRWLSWLSELQPEMFCEVSPQRGLGHRQHRQGRDRMPGPGHQPHPTPEARPAHRAPDRAPLPLGIEGPGPRGRRQRVDRLRRRSQRLDPGVEVPHGEHRTGAKKPRPPGGDERSAGACDEGTAGRS